MDFDALSATLGALAGAIAGALTRSRSAPQSPVAAPQSQGQLTAPQPGARGGHPGYEPVTPRRDGRIPGFIVACRDCEFAVDAHGATGEEAVAEVAPSHDATHHVYAIAVDYSDHPVYRRTR